MSTPAWRVEATDPNHKGHKIVKFFLDEEHRDLFIAEWPGEVSFKQVRVD